MIIRSAKLAPYVDALDRAGVRINPNWNAAQIMAHAQNLLPHHAQALKAGRERAWERMRAGEGVIYLCEATEHYPIVKMGYALNIEKRMRVLAREYKSIPLRLLRATPGDFRRERWLHSVLRHHRWPGRCHREFYRADYLYQCGVDLPQGFMIALSSLLDREKVAA